MLSYCGAEEGSWESLGLQGTKPVHPKGNQPWISIGRTDAEAEAPVLWPPDAKSWLTEDPDSGKDWRQKEKGAAEDVMVGCHHQLNGMLLSKLWETMKDRDVWYATVHGVTKSQNDLATEQQQHTTHPGGENPTYVSMPRWAPALYCRRSAVLEKAHMGIWVWMEVDGQNG